MTSQGGRGGLGGTSECASLIRTPPSNDPSVGLCLGTYGGPRGMGVSYEGGKPANGQGLTSERSATSMIASLISGFGIRVSNFGIQVSGFGIRVSDFGIRVSGFRSRVSGFGSRDSEFWIRVSGFGFREASTKRNEDERSGGDLT